MRLEELISVVNSLDHPSECPEFTIPPSFNLDKMQSGFYMFNHHSYPIKLIDRCTIHNSSSGTLVLYGSTVPVIDSIQLTNINSILFINKSEVNIDKLIFAIDDPYLLESNLTQSFYRAKNLDLPKKKFIFKDVKLSGINKYELINGTLLKNGMPYMVL